MNYYAIFIFVRDYCSIFRWYLTAHFHRRRRKSCSQFIFMCQTKSLRELITAGSQHIVLKCDLPRNNCQLRLTPHLLGSQPQNEVSMALFWIHLRHFSLFRLCPLTPVWLIRWLCWHAPINRGYFRVSQQHERRPFHVLGENANYTFTEYYNLVKRKLKRAGSSVGIATELRAVRSGDRIPVGAKLSAPAQTDPGTHPASCTTSLLGGKEWPGRVANPSPLLVLWSRKSRVISLLSLWAVRPLQSLSACTVQLYLYSPYKPYCLYRASVPVQ